MGYAARFAAVFVVEMEVVMLAIALVLIVGSGWGIAAPPQRYDLIEVNSVYQEDGKLAYKQVLFRDWSPDYRRYHTHAWMIPREINEFPAKTGQKWVVKWTFGQISFHVEAKMYRETETLGDPERYERRFLFKEEWRTPLVGRKR